MRVINNTKSGLSPEKAKKGIRIDSVISDAPKGVISSTKAQSSDVVAGTSDIDVGKINTPQEGNEKTSAEIDAEIALCIAQKKAEKLIPPLLEYVMAAREKVRPIKTSSQCIDCCKLSESYVEDFEKLIRFIDLDIEFSTKQDIPGYKKMFNDLKPGVQAAGILNSMDYILHTYQHHLETLG